MNSAVCEPRIEAALSCYQLADRRRPGSFQAEAAELAIMYTLSERRDAADVDELVQRALHDGGRGVARRFRTKASVERELTRLSAVGVATAGAPAAVVAETPEHSVLARALLMSSSDAPPSRQPRAAYRGQTSQLPLNARLGPKAPRHTTTAVMQGTLHELVDVRRVAPLAQRVHDRQLGGLGLKRPRPTPISQLVATESRARYAARTQHCSFVLPRGTARDRFP